MLKKFFGVLFVIVILAASTLMLVIDLCSKASMSMGIPIGWC